VLRHLACLRKCHHFPKFIHSAKTAGEYDERFGDLREPQFAHEEIVKIEAELGADVRVRKLFVRQLDGQADGFASSFVSAAIGGFHDSGSAAGANYEATRTRPQGESPRCQFMGEL